MISLKEYEEKLAFPLQQATITLLIDKDKQRVILGKKLRGFGVGKWNGAGGKANQGEEITVAMIRETEEEFGLTPLVFMQVAALNFYFPLVPPEKNYDQQVIVYKSTRWRGKIRKTEEMLPRWFKINRMPYNKMWPDDKLWMPRVFAGALITASFMFGDNEEIIEHYLKEVSKLD